MRTLTYSASLPSTRGVSPMPMTTLIALGPWLLYFSMSSKSSLNPRPALPLRLDSYLLPDIPYHLTERRTK